MSPSVTPTFAPVTSAQRRPTRTQGAPWLLEEVCGLYDGRVDSRSVVTCVPQEGIFMAVSAILDEGVDRSRTGPYHVVSMHPCYQSLMEVARSTGAAVDSWTAKEDDLRYASLLCTRTACHRVHIHAHTLHTHCTHIAHTLHMPAREHITRMFVPARTCPRSRRRHPFAAFVVPVQLRRRGARGSAAA